ncbi:hypothetical protein ACE7GA_14110 [Roseomonas sp. CCTCC AB2023176]|uniref:hypothetical protein n=1 Tax=Roseomonas sp. CCTCC AB2023176 TaxID=3342640 RepID=UPI0035D820FF
MTRHGNWLEGRVTGGGRDGCIAGTGAQGQGSFQATIGRTPDAGVILIIAVRAERANFTADAPIRFAVDDRTFEFPGQANPGGSPAMLIAANTEEEARRLSDLLVAMQRGREVRITPGTARPITLSLTGASPALNGMRACARRAGMMPG